MSAKTCHVHFHGPEQHSRSRKEKKLLGHPPTLSLHHIQSVSELGEPIPGTNMRRIIWHPGLK